MLSCCLLAYFLPRRTDELSPSLPFIDRFDETMSKVDFLQLWSRHEAWPRPDLCSKGAMRATCATLGIWTARLCYSSWRKLWYSRA